MSNLAAVSPVVNRSVYYLGVSDATVHPVPTRTYAARERIERAAARLFYRNGIHATGVELVAREANVSKRTLYQHFASKNDLVDNYLRGIDARGGSLVEKRLGDVELPARERLLAIFDFPRSEVVRGCPFHNAAVESAGSLAGTDAIVRAHKANVHPSPRRDRAGGRSRRPAPAGPSAGGPFRGCQRDGDVAERHRTCCARTGSRGHADRCRAAPFGLLTRCSRCC